MKPDKASTCSSRPIMAGVLALAYSAERPCSSATALAHPYRDTRAGAPGLVDSDILCVSICAKRLSFGPPMNDVVMALATGPGIVTWLRKAAEAGHSGAISFVGGLHDKEQRQISPSQ
jgi:hypothetical protein